MLALCALANTSWAGVLMQAAPHTRGDEPMLANSIGRSSGRVEIGIIWDNIEKLCNAGPILPWNVKDQSAWPATSSPRLP